MTTPDPIADRAAQIDAAWAAYSTGRAEAAAECKRRTDRAYEDFGKAEYSLFETYRARVDAIISGKVSVVRTAGNDG